MTELAENPQDSFDPCLARRCSARTIVDAAADGTLTADRITDLIAEAARAQSIATYTGELRQRTERLFVGAFYEALQDGAAESRGLADQRRRMLAGLAGQVVEIGAGNGLNFAHYPPTVTRVHAFEPEPYLRTLAMRAAERSAVPVSVGDRTAEDLPLEDAGVDAAVASLVLCSVRDLGAAVAELHRVVRPGGELRFNEHVASRRPFQRAVQRTADATIWPTISGGCHLARDTEAAFEDGGFRMERVERFVFSVSALDPPKSHILGCARRL